MTLTTDDLPFTKIADTKSQNHPRTKGLFEFLI